MYRLFTTYMAARSLARTLILQIRVMSSQIREFCDMGNPYDIISYYASHRKPSDLIGRGMPYFNEIKYVAQIIQNPELYGAVRKIAGQMKVLHQLEDFEEGYERENGIICNS